MCVELNFIRGHLMKCKLDTQQVSMQMTTWTDILISIVFPLANVKKKNNMHRFQRHSNKCAVIVSLPQPTQSETSSHVAPLCKLCCAIIMSHKKASIILEVPELDDERLHAVLIECYATFPPCLVALSTAMLLFLS